MSTDLVSNRARHYRTILICLSICLSICLLVPVVAACDTVSATPTTVPFASGGLGLTRAEWEQKHAFLLSIPGSDYIYEGYNPPLFGYRVNYWQESVDDPTARISAIAVDGRLVLSDTGQLSPSVAGTATLTRQQMQQAAKAMLPTDAQLQGTQNPSATGTFTETFRSASLQNVYPPLAALKDPWNGQPPGTIRVVYESGGPDMLITAGAGVPNTGSPLEILPTETPVH